MEQPSVRLHIDDRGVPRQLLDLWLPYLDVVAVWVVDAPTPEPTDGSDFVPLIPLSATDVAAVASERALDPGRVLAVFGTAESLRTAAMLGLEAGRVTIHHLCPDGDRQRIAPGVELTEATVADLLELEDRGFSFEIQPNPHVTARRWSPRLDWDRQPVDAGSPDR